MAVNVAATMGVVAGKLSSTGIRLNMRLYTATAVEADFSLRGMKLLRLDLSLPRSKQEIFAAKWVWLIDLLNTLTHTENITNIDKIEHKITY